jgi:hypothetical protein
MKLNKNEIENVSLLEPLKRYHYLLKKVADSEKIYTMTSKGGDWASSVIKEYNLFPVWPTNEFALNCKIDAWSDFDVIEINLYEFINIKLSAIEKEGFLLNVFPTGVRTGFVVKSDEFIRDINAELENYE